jgi:hypothetical protein
LLNETPIYYTALALHPAYRWDWFTNAWNDKPDWVAEAKRIVENIWVTDYSYIGVRISSQSSEDSSLPAERSRFYDLFTANNRISQPLRSIVVIGDEYEVWQRDRDSNDGNVREPLAYWVAKQERYPRLSQMALDFLTIQPMSSECERAFSTAGRMATNLLGSLDASIIGVCQVLRSWYLAGVLPKTDTTLAPIELGDYDGGESNGEGDSEGVEE